MVVKREGTHYSRAMQMTPVNDNVGAGDLSPDEFSQWAKKNRFFRAMASAISRSGYGEAAVADILHEAGMSRRTFYDLFENKEDCFLQAYDAAVRRVRMVVGAAYHNAGGWVGLRGRVELGLGAFLDRAIREATVHWLDVIDAVGGDEPEAMALERARDVLAAVADPLAFIEAASGRSGGTVLRVMR